MHRIPRDPPPKPSAARKALGIGVGIVGAIIGAVVGALVGHVIVYILILFYGVFGFTSPLMDIVGAFGLSSVALFILNWGLQLIGAAWFGWAGYLVAYGLVVKNHRKGGTYDY